jgi:hypothetical protein
MSTANERKQLEEQIIHLMLSHHDLVGEFNNSQNRTHHFLKEHQVVLDAMFEASAASAALTRFTLREFLSQRNLLKQEIIAYESLYHNIRLLTGVKRDDFHALLKKKRAMWVDDQTIAQIDRFTKNHKDDPIYAAKELAEKVSATLDEVDKPSYVTFDTLDNEQFIKGYLDDQELRRQHDEPNLTCGISEIDSVMGTGFSPETLTVIAADVGSYKSTLMLNIALGVWEKHGADVLFVPLEMPKYRIVDKIVSRELGIDGNTLAKPKFLKPVESGKSPRHQGAVCNEGRPVRHPRNRGTYDRKRHPQADREAPLAPPAETGRHRLHRQPVARPAEPEAERPRNRRHAQRPVEDGEAGRGNARRLCRRHGCPVEPRSVEEDPCRQRYDVHLAGVGGYSGIAPVFG